MVFAGEFWAGASGLGLADGFRKQGWFVQTVDQDRYVGNFGRSYLARGMRRITDKWAAEAFRQEILSACELLKPDLFMTIKGIHVEANMLEKIRSLGTKTAIFYPDVDFAHANVAFDSFKHYAHILTTKKFHLEPLRQSLAPEKVDFVHHGYSSAVHRPVFSGLTEADTTADVLHVGTYSPYKEQWLAPIVERLPGVSLNIIGDQWQEAVAGRPIAKAVYGKGIVGVGYPIAIQTAKINVAILYGPTASGWQDSVSTRSFEIPACRGFMLHIDNDEIRSLYTVGEEIDVFASSEELVDKIRFYLAQPDLRANMVARAYQRCVPAYSYDARAMEILKKIEKTTSGLTKS